MDFQRVARFLLWFGLALISLGILIGFFSLLVILPGIIDASLEVPRAGGAMIVMGVLFNIAGLVCICVGSLLKAVSKYQTEEGEEGEEE